jgi:hypothetical protein
MAISFRVRIAWNGTFGSFAGGVYDDVTAFVRDDPPVTIRRGFQEDKDRIAAIGTAYLTLDNSDRRFTPKNDSGPLYGYILPQRPIVIEASPDGFAGTTWGLFRGYVRRVRVEADEHGNRRAFLECEDALAWLYRQRFAQPLQENRTADELYALILSSTFRGAAATGYVQPSGGGYINNPNDGDTVTVGEKTYTFRTSISDAYDVLIGGGGGATMRNLAAAINTGEANGDEAGTIYGTNTLKNEEVSAEWIPVEETEIVNKCILTCLYRGALGNDIGLSTNSGGRLYVTAATLTGGTDEPAGLVSHEAGQRTYIVAGDRWALETTNAMRALEDVVASEFGWAWVAGDGTLTTKSYQWELKQASESAAMTLINTHSAMEATIDDDKIANRINVINTPTREVTGVIIAQAHGTIAVPGKITDTRWNQAKALPGARVLNALPPGSLVMRLPFTDAGTGQVTGAKDLIVPVRGADYRIFENTDGSGFDYTTNPVNRVTCSVVVMGSGVEVTFSNTAIGMLYVFDFQVRGTRIERYDPQTILRENADSIDAYGERSMDYDLPLDAGDNFPTALANFLLSQYATPVQRGDPVVIHDALTLIGGVYPISLDIGNNIEVTETQTGTSAQKYLIRSISTTLTAQSAVMTLGVKEISNVTYWILGDTTFSVLGTTTRLGL